MGEVSVGRVGVGSSARAGSGVEAVGWAPAVAVLVLVIWLVPIRSYRLPVALPFNLELYRLVIIVLGFAWVLSLLAGKGQLGAGGLGVPLGLFAAGTTASLLVNLHSIEAVGLQTQSIKSLSYELSFLLGFVLVYSTLRSARDVDRVVRALVIGGGLVAVSALIEERTHYNVFDHLQSAVPFLIHVKDSAVKIRFGRLRVVASSQHPIALGVALVTTAPLALYLARTARTKAATRLWVAVALALCGGSLATQSRTVLVALATMVCVGLWLRRRAITRLWPLVPVLLVAVHFAAPATLSGLYHAFQPKGGIIAEESVRAGASGSGRLADIGPGLRMWEAKPVFGQGPGTAPVRGATQAQKAAGGAQIIFDDQYLRQLVEGGIVGFLALASIVWGAFLKLGRAAKRTTGPPSDLLVATAASCAGFAMSMWTFDALAFVQVTLLFFLIASLGLRAATLVSEQPQT